MSTLNVLTLPEICSSGSNFDASAISSKSGALAFTSICEGVEDVQGFLTLFFNGAAQVCHALRVDELSEQLEVEEEDGDRQEEEEEIKSGEASQGECAM